VRGAGSSPLGGKGLIPLLTLTLEQYQLTTPLSPSSLATRYKKTTFQKLIITIVVMKSVVISSLFYSVKNQHLKNKPKEWHIAANH
jgi:hypothetical protein